MCSLQAHKHIITSQAHYCITSTLLHHKHIITSQAFTRAILYGGIITCTNYVLVISIHEGCIRPSKTPSIRCAPPRQKTHPQEDIMTNDDGTRSVTRGLEHSSSKGLSQRRISNVNTIAFLPKLRSSGIHTQLMQDN